MTVKEKMTTREFLKNYTSINSPVKIYNRNVVKGVYLPYLEFEKLQNSLKNKAGKKNTKKISLSEIDQFTFKGGKNLSSSVDEIYL